ncbi:Protein of unknown function [Rhodovulum sp. ES.010]|uniref:DUF2478 domain-containing protein n=1 Tax=Rhodovulum sp. ES.010 TaxID=1882821 RepID=UPI000928D7B7|nr:DUF2478 domain-containing protein [Rhodovulum sp. ES.010]SIO38145.1 Protein of unknown function [Rhodovulum sp. ES.010]
MDQAAEDRAETGIAAIPLAENVPVDALLAGVVAALAAEGCRVAGFRQMRTDGGIALEDLAGGDMFAISQSLGPGSRGCSLDPRGLAEAAGAALRALETGPDLVVLPRYGKAEAEGHGFRAVIARACERQIPVLVAVRPACESSWLEFTGGLAARLDPDPDALLSWCRAALADRR